MKVYVLIESFYEHWDILGVFDSKELAEKYKSDCAKYTYAAYLIYEYEVKKRGG